MCLLLECMSMSHDITASLEAEYEPAHEEVDDEVVIGSTGCFGGVSDEPFCSASGDDTEMQFDA